MSASEKMFFSFMNYGGGYLEEEVRSALRRSRDSLWFMKYSPLTYGVSSETQKKATTKPHPAYR